MESPTPDQVKAWRKAAGFTQLEAATIVRSSRRAWQGWEAPRALKSSRRMHPALWDLFLWHVSPLIPTEARKSLEKEKKMPAQEAG